MSGTTVAGAVAAATASLAAQGIAGAGHEARILAAHALGCDRAALFGCPERELTGAEHAVLARLVGHRATRAPMAQVIGVQEFWSLDLAVTDATLIPRPDSETLVRYCLELAGGNAPRKVLDLGVGTGCLLIALMTAWRQCDGLGVDRSQAALDIAARNARALGVASRASFVRGDWCSGIGARFDLVVSNPPYVPTGEIDGLEPEVARHEPRIALDGGADGLECYRRILPRLADVLAAKGVAVLEHGAGQGGALEAMAAAHGLSVAGSARDLSGQRRCLALRISRERAEPHRFPGNSPAK